MSDIPAYLPLGLGMGGPSVGGKDPLIKQTLAERIVSNTDSQSLVNEYHLIKQKKSKLSRSQRDAVENRVLYLVKMGRVNIKQSKTK